MMEDYSISGRGKRFCSNIQTGYGVCQGSHAVGSDSPFHMVSSVPGMRLTTHLCLVLSYECMELCFHSQYTFMACTGIAGFCKQNSNIVHHHKILLLKFGWHLPNVLLYHCVCVD